MKKYLMLLSILGAANSAHAKKTAQQNQNQNGCQNLTLKRKLKLIIKF